MNLSSILNMGRNKPAEQSTPTATAATLPAVPPTAKEREEILAIVEKFFGPVQTGPARFEAPTPPPVPESVIATIARDAGPLLDETQLATARGLESEWRLAMNSLNACGRDKIAKAFAEHQEAVAESTIAGKPITDAWTKEEIETDFASRRHALKAAAAKRSQEAGEIFAIAAGKLISHIRARAEGEAIEEFRRFAAYGVDFTPGRLVHTLLAASRSLERMADRSQNKAGGLGRDPRALFAIIGIEL